MVKAMLLPAPAMVLGQGVPALLDQLERHCLAPDASLVSKPVYLDLLQVTSFLPPFSLRSEISSLLASHGV